MWKSPVASSPRQPRKRSLLICEEHHDREHSDLLILVPKPNQVASENKNTTTVRKNNVVPHQFQMIFFSESLHSEWWQESSFMLFLGMMGTQQKSLTLTDVDVHKLCIFPVNQYNFPRVVFSTFFHACHTFESFTKEPRSNSSFTSIRPHRWFAHTLKCNPLEHPLNYLSLHQVLYMSD